MKNYSNPIVACFFFGHVDAVFYVSPTRSLSQERGIVVPVKQHFFSWMEMVKQAFSM